ncbi:MAG: hypothetical protein ABSH31_11940 [Bryobacteraceae bacterium]|jgi:hypothetical protein
MESSRRNFVFYTAANWTSNTQLGPELITELQRLVLVQVHEQASGIKAPQ